MVLISRYTSDLTGVHAENQDVKLSVSHDSTLRAPVLIVEYPAKTDDPAGRDTWCDAEVRDWSGGNAISVRIKSEKSTKLSISFFDRNRVAYTTWVELEAGAWQPVEVAFEEVLPNPFFQPPDAKQGQPIDVSHVEGIAFAPQGDEAGQLTVSEFSLLR